MTIEEDITTVEYERLAEAVQAYSLKAPFLSGVKTTRQRRAPAYGQYSAHSNE